MTGFDTTATPGSDWADLARNAGGDASPAERPEDLRQLLTFEIADTPYAVPVERVREIVRIRPITPVPRVPREIRGVISLRGEIVEVIDLRLRLGLEASETGRATRIIVVSSETGKIAGVMVDAVREVLRLPEESISPTASGESDCVEALCARGEEFVSLVDLDRILEIDAEH